MSVAPHQQGFTSLVALAALILMAALLGGLVFNLDQSLTEEKRLAGQREFRLALETVAGQILAKMEKDFDPEKMAWPVFVAANPAESGILAEGALAEGSDLSGLVNLNTIHEILLRTTALGTLFAPLTADQVVEKRFKAGPWREADLADLVDVKKNVWFTTWGRLNPNTTDDMMVEKLVGLRAGNEGLGQSVRQRGTQLRLAGTVVTADDVRAKLGLDDVTQPLFDLTPEINVNTADPFVLQALLAYAPFKVSDPAGKAAQIVAQRQTKYLTLADFKALMGSDLNPGGLNPALFQYLGTKSAFFRLTVRAGGEKAGPKLSLVLATTAEKADNGTRFQIMEKVWLP